MSVGILERRRVARPSWIALSVFLVFAASNAPAPLYVVWQREMGFPPSAVSLIFVSYIVGSVVALVFGGRASDRFGRRAVLLPALGLAIVACLVFATARTPLWLETGRFFIGLASGAFGAAGSAAIADAFGPGRGGRAALYASAAPVAGSAVGPLLSGVLADVAPAPTRLVFLVLIVPLAAAVIPLTAVGGRPAGVGGRWVQLPSIPREIAGTVVLAMAVAGSPFALAGLFISLGPALIADLLGNDSRTLAGAVSFVVFGAGASAQFLVRRMSIYRVAVVGLSVSALAAVLIAVAVGAASVPVIVVAAIAAGLGQSLAQLAGLTLARGYAPAVRTAEVVSMVWLAGYATVGSGILGLGFLADGIGLRPATYAFCGFFLACVCGAGVAVMRRRPVVEALDADTH